MDVNTCAELRNLFTGFSFFCCFIGSQFNGLLAFLVVVPLNQYDDDDDDGALAFLFRHAWKQLSKSL